MNIDTEVRYKEKLDKAELDRLLEKRTNVSWILDDLDDPYLSQPYENYLYLTYFPELVAAPTARRKFIM